MVASTNGGADLFAGYKLNLAELGGWEAVGIPLMSDDNALTFDASGGVAITLDSDNPSVINLVVKQVGEEHVFMPFVRNNRHVLLDMSHLLK